MADIDYATPTTKETRWGLIIACCVAGTVLLWGFLQVLVDCRWAVRAHTVTTIPTLPATAPGGGGAP